MFRFIRPIFGGGGSKDIRKRLQKARGAFWRLWKVWAAGGVGRRAKICLRPILRIRWQLRMTNRRVVEMAGTDEISCQVQRRRWNWLGNILRREGVNDCFAALGRTPEGETAGGRPKTTWRRAVKRKRGKAGCKSWNVAKAVACDWGGGGR